MPCDEVTVAAGRVRGLRRVDRGSGGVSLAFHGIPFATHPEGAMRFSPPHPAAPWQGVRDARQPADIARTGLHLNVFTPDVDATLPVLFWIHGGGFTSGSPHDEQLDGMSLNRAGIVLVSASYRLGFEGFGHLDGVRENRGVRDWIAALEWVQTSIRTFGGDPDQVTIAGHSAGAGAVLALLGMPRAQHLFHRALSLSAALGAVTPQRARQRALRLADLAGVDVEGLAGIAPARLRALLPDAASAARGDDARVERMREGLPWGPIVDGDLVPLAAADAVRAGVGADKPLLIGATDEEFTPAQLARDDELAGLRPSELLRPLLRDNGVRRAYLASNAQTAAAGGGRLLGRLMSDGICRMLVPQFADLRDTASAPTWAYRFCWASPVTRASSHTIDLPFWFDGLVKPRALTLLGDDAPQQLADAMHAALVAFVRGEDPGWPSWRRDRPTARVLGCGAEQVSMSAYDSVRPLIGGI